MNKNKRLQSRRDRHLAKASGFSREGTKNPRKIGHHSYSNTNVGGVKAAQVTPKPLPPPTLPKIKVLRSQFPVKKTVKNVEKTTAKVSKIKDLKSEFVSCSAKKQNA
jgi:hypothetical protein